MHAGTNKMVCAFQYLKAASKMNISCHVGRSFGGGDIDSGLGEEGEER